MSRGDQLPSKERSSVYPIADCYSAIIINNDTHWRNLVDALGRPKLRQDIRFFTVADRCANMDAVDAEIAALTHTHTKTDSFDLLIARRVACAPVRTLVDVVNDPHLHERGSLRRIDHPKYGPIMVPASPLGFEGTEPQSYPHKRAARCRHAGHPGRAAATRCCCARRIGYGPHCLMRATLPPPLAREGLPSCLDAS